MSSAKSRAAADAMKRLGAELNAETARRLDLERQAQRAGVAFDGFVSGAAHDLREALREMTAFSQLLAEECDGGQGASAAHLSHVQQASERMQRLLTSMVDYSAAGATPVRPVRVDAEAALCQALLCLEQRIAGRRASITHDPLPPVVGEFDALSKTLLHLVSNAIEYSGEAPRVHVSARTEADECVFSVQDNGPGVEPEFRERIFTPFKRLHGRELSGAGLGLAFCKQAVERQGGRIWVEDAPEGGSRFLFTLPAAE